MFYLDKETNKTKQLFEKRKPHRESAQPFLEKVFQPPKWYRGAEPMKHHGESEPPGPQISILPLASLSTKEVYCPQGNPC